MKIILASASPRRQQLLSYLINDFQTLTADLNEEKFIALARSPEEFVTKLSLSKAKKVISKHQLSNSIMITADTIVVLGQKDNFQIIGKPKNREDARKILKLLRNQTHQVYTGFSIINQKTNEIITNYSLSYVTFKLFSDEELENYLEEFKPYDKAGSYAIQEMGSKYIEKYEGSLTDIIGLPLEQIAPILQKFSVKLNPNWEKELSKKVIFS